MQGANDVKISIHYSKYVYIYFIKTTSQTKAPQNQKFAGLGVGVLSK